MLDPCPLSNHSSAHCDQERELGTNTYLSTADLEDYAERTCSSLLYLTLQTLGQCLALQTLGQCLALQTLGQCLALQILGQCLALQILGQCLALQTLGQYMVCMYMYVWKNDCLGCAVLLCLAVCLTLLVSSFLLISH